MDASFKTRLFGGFDREDVVTYIEKTAAENQTQLEALRAEVETLRKQRDEAVSENEALRGLTEEDAKLREENARLQAQLAQAQADTSALRSECEALRGPASEYQSLKEHIAEIEISAHRRTEEFRAKAMERLAQCIAQQRAWCGQRRSTYAHINAALLDQLRQAEQAVESADFAAFDGMIAELQRMEDELKQPDPQI